MYTHEPISPTTITAATSHFWCHSTSSSHSATFRGCHAPGGPCRRRGAGGPARAPGPHVTQRRKFRRLRRRQLVGVVEQSSLPLIGPPARR